MKNASTVKYFKLSVIITLFILSAIIIITVYQQKKVSSETYCDIGSVAKDESAPYAYNGDTIITEIGIKAGTGCYVFTGSGNNECYNVIGLGTNAVSVTKIGSGPSCKDISHVSFFSTPPSITPQSPSPIAQSPSPALTITNTPPTTINPSITATVTSPTTGTSTTPSMLTSTPSPTDSQINTSTPEDDGSAASDTTSTGTSSLPVAGNLSAVTAIVLPIVLVVAGFML